MGSRSSNKSCLQQRSISSAQAPACCDCPEALLLPAFVSVLRWGLLLLGHQAVSHLILGCLELSSSLSPLSSRAKYPPQAHPLENILHDSQPLSCRDTETDRQTNQALKPLKGSSLQAPLINAHQCAWCRIPYWYVENIR